MSYRDRDRHRDSDRGRNYRDRDRRDRNYQRRGRGSGKSRDRDRDRYSKDDRDREREHKPSKRETEAKYAQHPPEDMDGRRFDGVVNTFYHEKSYGFIKGSDNLEVFVHRRHITTPGIVVLHPGQYVTFRKSKDEKGRVEACDVDIQPQDPDQRQRGRILQYNEDRCFGFIMAYDGGSDIFFHIDQIRVDKAEVNEQGHPSLTLFPGMFVEYNLMHQEDGKRRATDVSGPNEQPLSLQKRPTKHGGMTNRRPNDPGFEKPNHGRYGAGVRMDDPDGVEIYEREKKRRNEFNNYDYKFSNVPLQNGQRGGRNQYRDQPIRGGYDRNMRDPNEGYDYRNPPPTGRRFEGGSGFTPNPNITPGSGFLPQNQTQNFPPPPRQNHGGSGFIPPTNLNNQFGNHHQNLPSRTPVYDASPNPQSTSIMSPEYPSQGTKRKAEIPLGKRPRARRYVTVSPNPISIAQQDDGGETMTIKNMNDFDLIFKFRTNHPHLVAVSRRIGVIPRKMKLRVQVTGKGLANDTGGQLYLVLLTAPNRIVGKPGFEDMKRTWKTLDQATIHQQKIEVILDVFSD